MKEEIHNKYQDIELPNRNNRKKDTCNQYVNPMYVQGQANTKETFTWGSYDLLFK